MNDSNISELHSPGLNTNITVTDQSFTWLENTYCLVSAGILNDYAFAETDPRNTVLELKIATAIAADRLSNPDFNKLREQLAAES